MHDQLGGGFHRYSVDERWFVPHFEKMLYDQAQLAISYLEAFQITHDPFYAKIARSTLDYVLRDMTASRRRLLFRRRRRQRHRSGESQGKGRGRVLCLERRGVAASAGRSVPAFCVDLWRGAEGQCSDDPHGEFTGKNILYLRESLDDATEAELEAAKRALLAIRREARPATSGRQDPDFLERSHDFSLR